MTNADNKSFSIMHLSEEGQVTIPGEYRRALSLSSKSSLAIVQVGDALVIAPYDDELASATSRLEAKMRDAGVNVEDLTTAATEARAEIVREEFGKGDTL